MIMLIEKKKERKTNNNGVLKGEKIAQVRLPRCSELMSIVRKTCVNAVERNRH